MLSGSVNPTWTANSYFETKPAGVKTDIATFFNGNNPRTQSFTFTKQFSVAPQLAYGIKNYRGNFLDSFRQRSIGSLKLCNCPDPTPNGLRFHNQSDSKRLHAHQNPDIAVFGSGQIVSLPLEYFQ